MSPRYSLGLWFEVNDDTHTSSPEPVSHAVATGDRVAHRLLVPLGLLFIVLVLVFHVLFSTTSVSGDSMEPTLLNGDRLLVTKSYTRPERGDVVIFRTVGANGEEEGLIKRVVALEGDAVEIRQGVALVNGGVEAYASVRTSGMDDTYHDQTIVPEDHVYVLGDNRPVALDSRDLGPVPLKAVKGRVVYIWAPVSRYGGIR